MVGSFRVECCRVGSSTIDEVRDPVIGPARTVQRGEARGSASAMLAPLAGRGERYHGRVLHPEDVERFRRMTPEERLKMATSPGASCCAFLRRSASGGSVQGVPEPDYLRRWAVALGIEERLTRVLEQRPITLRSDLADRAAGSRRPSSV
jgi:hypothetical protein